MGDRMGRHQHLTPRTKKILVLFFCPVIRSGRSFRIAGHTDTRRRQVYVGQGPPLKWK
jgi:hypothetical protein